MSSTQVHEIPAVSPSLTIIWHYMWHLCLNRGVPSYPTQCRPGGEHLPPQAGAVLDAWEDWGSESGNQTCGLCPELGSFPGGWLGRPCCFLDSVWHCPTEKTSALSCLERGVQALQLPAWKNWVLSCYRVGCVPGGSRLWAGGRKLMSPGFCHWVPEPSLQLPNLLNFQPDIWHQLLTPADTLCPLLISTDNPVSLTNPSIILYPLITPRYSVPHTNPHRYSVPLLPQLLVLLNYPQILCTPYSPLEILSNP